ncbi:MAG: ABC transporter ATP-binding protein, partial [Cyclobacteriaceae bacterium]|nr:ABC transporter ATP-binding protein [Cyclobacteriaceae bacterium]
MKIVANSLGKKYFKEWVISDFDYSFTDKKKYAVVGPNGSGKSTLLKVLSGYIPVTKGSVNYFSEENLIENDTWYKSLLYVSPYTELIEEFTLEEHVNFHFNFCGSSIDYSELLEKLSLSKARKKRIKNFSSGMKQRLKLGLSIFSDKKILFLDEPTMNLDAIGIDLYQNLLETYCNDKLVIIASNQSYETEQ